MLVSFVLLNSFVRCFWSGKKIFLSGKSGKSQGKIFHELAGHPVSTHTHAGSETIPLSTKTPLTLLMSAFFLQKICIFVKNSTFTQGNSMRAVS